MSVRQERMAWGWADLRGWNLYFLSKLVLAWMGSLNLHVGLNFALLVALLVPLRQRWARVGRAVLAVPLAVALYYRDTWWPPISGLFAQPGVVDFAWSYYLELAWRFVSGPVVLALVVLVLAWLLLRHWLRITALTVLGMLVLGVASLPVPAFLARSSTGTPTVAAAGEAAPLNAGTVGAWLESFYQQQSTRMTRFPAPAPAAAPFDVIVLNICSLAWDDLDVIGMRHNALYDHMDVVFDDFNSATSYSGPAAIRLLRASCGQTPHKALYAPAAPGCYLFDNLRKLGFASELAMNHDGHFDNFIADLTVRGGLQAKPLDISRLPTAMRAFDDSPLRRDSDVLNAWLKRREAEPDKQVALFYNTISLHDGNRIVAADGSARDASYKPRVQRVLGDIAQFIEALQASGRRAVVIVVPEHGDNLRGDRMQIPGMRDIPTPAITHVPVALKLVNMGFPALAAPQQVTAPSSFLAISELVSRLYAINAGEGAGRHDWASLLHELPTTPSVSENEGSVVVSRQGQTWLKLKNGPWSIYPGGR